MNALFRLVTETGHERHMGSVVLTEDEAHEALAFEGAIHDAAGWMVGLAVKERIQDAVLACLAHDGTVRIISVVQVNENEAIHDRL